MKTGANLRQFVDEKSGTTESTVYSLSFSPDSRFVLTGHEDGEAVLWDASTGAVLRQFKDSEQGTHDVVVLSMAFWPDGRYILTGSEDGVVRLWDVASGELLHRFEGHDGPVFSVAFSLDGRYMLTGGYDGTARLWDPASGKELHLFVGHSGEVNSVVFSSSGHFLMTGGSDGTLRLWLTTTDDDHADVTITPTWTGGWTVIARDGRFDTGNLEKSWNLHWVVPDDPYTPLPLEIFMRDYYEPRLLPRMLAGEKFADLPRLEQLNRVQPKVTIRSITPDCSPDKAGKAQIDPDNVTVEVEVEGASGTYGRDGETITRKTGVYDLRLFRDGQLVGQWPAPGDDFSTYKNREEELRAWRKAHLIQIDPMADKQTITFRGVRLPHKKGVKEVNFTAYAFNEDRVKSITARKKFTLPPTITPRAGRAYIIAIGVNAFETPAWDLNYAANDAHGYAKVLTERLKTQTDPATNKPVYTEVIPVTLVSDKVEKGKKRTISVNHARKDRIKAVFDALAGKPVDPARLQGIENAEKLTTIAPDDLLIVALSTHGDAGNPKDPTDQGRFYFLPYDIGPDAPKEFDATLRRRAISSDMLSAWLREVDAGEFVMIVDACHSAATVESKEFKPGPMGSRGLGQLAFDKGMRILAASQVRQYAYEPHGSDLGLLSHALLRDGLEKGEADYKPADKRILMSEWLNFGVEHVPVLYRQWREGKRKGGGVDPLPGEKGTNASLQQPALFDFARGRDVLLSGEGGRP